MSLPSKVGKYEIGEQIGRGGFATVYLAFDPLIKRRVAIKICSSEDEALRHRFLREAEIAGGLDHPNIVRVFDFGYFEEGSYLVQEYLSGEDLKVKIRDRAPMSFPERIRYLLELADGMAYAHSRGVLHRDIKPGNVRVLDNSSVKILDFGIAKVARTTTPLTLTGTVLGTAGYLAPEQLLEQEVDGRSDVFSFGALAYHLLTFSPPFPGSNVTEILRNVVTLNPPPVSATWKECPPEMDRLVAQCLHKDKDQRTGGFDEVVARLNAILVETEPSTGRPRPSLRLLRPTSPLRSMRPSPWVVEPAHPGASPPPSPREPCGGVLAGRSLPGPLPLSSPWLSCGRCEKARVRQSV